MRKGNVSSIYLTDYEWQLLDKLMSKHNVHNRCEMIRLLINWETERSGFSTVSLEQVQCEKNKLVAEIAKLDEQAERIKTQQPLISAREVNLNAEYDETIGVILRMIDRGDSLTDIERVAETRSKVYLKSKWLPGEIIKKAYEIKEKNKIEVI